MLVVSFFNYVIIAIMQFLNQYIISKKKENDNFLKIYLYLTESQESSYIG